MILPQANLVVLEAYRTSRLRSCVGGIGVSVISVAFEGRLGTAGGPGNDALESLGLVDPDVRCIGFPPLAPVHLSRSVVVAYKDNPVRKS